MIDYDAQSEAKGDKTLWSDREFGDFVLQVDWRLKEAPYINKNVPYILPDGTHARDIHGKELQLALPDADSGVYLRGDGDYQVNIWCWPIGSGEMYGIRTDPSTPPELRAAVTPRHQADKPVGEWNHFEITVRGKTVKVELNGKTVIPGATIPDLPDTGPARASSTTAAKNSDGRVDRAAQPRAVQEHLHQGTEVTAESRPAPDHLPGASAAMSENRSPERSPMTADEPARVPRRGRGIGLRRSRSCPARALGLGGNVAANSRINVAFIGVGSQGLRVMCDFLGSPTSRPWPWPTPSAPRPTIHQWGKSEFRNRVRKLLGVDSGWDWLSPNAPMLPLTPSFSAPAGRRGPRARAEDRRRLQRPTDAGRASRAAAPRSPTTARCSTGSRTSTPSWWARPTSCTPRPPSPR